MADAATTPTSSTPTSSTPTKFSRTDLSGHDKPKCRVIVPPLKGGWSEPAVFEWELTAESWTDEHPHSEYNFVIEGQLFVESGGVTLEAQTATSCGFPPARSAGIGRQSMPACLPSMGPARVAQQGIGLPETERSLGRYSLAVIG